MSLRSYQDWVDGVSDSIKNDALWKLDVYRDALFFFDLVWQNCETLLEHRLGRPIANQLGMGIL